jgi:protease I
MKGYLLAGIAMFLFCGGRGEQERPSQHGEATMIAKSVLIVIAHKNFRDEEFREPYDLFRNSGMKVVVASTDTTPAKGMLGMIVQPDITLEQVNSDEFDGLVVVGGTGCEELWDNKTLRDIVQRFNADNKLIAAICLAPVILGRAGILEERIVTAYPSVRDEIGKCCARCTDSDIEISGNIITCSGPKAAADFATTILGVMRK